MVPWRRGKVIKVTSEAKEKRTERELVKRNETKRKEQGKTNAALFMLITNLVNEFFGHSNEEKEESRRSNTPRFKCKAKKNQVK